jgi:hypothetical protein
MIENDKLTAAAQILPLKGKEYRLKPLTDIQIEEINTWVRGQHVRIAVSAAKGLPADEYDRVIQVALRDAHGLAWNEGLGLEIVGEPTGLAYIVWQSIRAEHPDLTHDDVRGLLMEKGDPKQTREKFRLAMALFRQANEVRIKNASSPVEGSALPPG